MHGSRDGTPIEKTARVRNEVKPLCPSQLIFLFVLAAGKCTLIYLSSYQRPQRRKTITLTFPLASDRSAITQNYAFTQTSDTTLNFHYLTIRLCSSSFSYVSSSFTPILRQYLLTPIGPSIKISLSQSKLPSHGCNHKLHPTPAK